MFARGEQLANQSLYFTQLSPTIDGEYVVAHTGDVNNGTATVDLWLVFQSVDTQTVRGERQTVTHWEQREKLASVDAVPFESGDKQRVPFSMDTSAVREQLAQIQAELGASPGTTEVVIVSEAFFSGAVDGNRLTETRTDRLQIELAPNTAGIVTDIEPPTTQTASEVVSVPATPSPLVMYGGVSAAIIGLVGTVGFLWFRFTGAFRLLPAERQCQSFEQAREASDQWICRGQLPDIGGRDVVEVKTLTDVTNVAMMSNSVVIEQRQPHWRYAVFREDIVYQFTPPAAVSERFRFTTADKNSHTALESKDVGSPVKE